TTVPWPLALQSKRRSLSKTFCRTFRTLSTASSTRCVMTIGILESRKLRARLGTVTMRTPPERLLPMLFELPETDTDNVISVALSRSD
ncbi:hypothetical protein NKJ70_32255, partial [Mesorhizobium sp. M0092]|uniref:hypothetical protein n=1 Tax=Mesorhizobium sp. M0092 TaxID=2956876 RepID=UPI00333B2A12